VTLRDREREFLERECDDLLRQRRAAGLRLRLRLRDLAAAADLALRAEPDDLDLARPAFFLAAAERRILRL